MEKSYSIAEARDNLASIVHDVEGGSAVGLTRRGKPVAALLSMDEYRRLATGKKDLWDAYIAFRRRAGMGDLDIGPEVFEGLRDPSPGREVDLRD